MIARALLVAAIAAVAGCAPAQPSALPQERPTIVSLNPCSDAILAEVADPAQILALSHYSRDRRSSSMDVALARRFPSTGGTVEEVLALRPDYVITSSFLAPSSRAAMERAGVKVQSFAIEHTVEESEARIREIARIAGRPHRGEALIARIHAALAAAAPPRGKPISAIVWQSGGIVPGGDALISDLMRRTGFTSQSAARGLGQADYLPLEEMLADPPRVVLAAGDIASGDARMLDHPALDGLKDTRRYHLDPTLVFCGGPTIIRAVGRLAEIRRRLENSTSARAEPVEAPLFSFLGGQGRKNGPLTGSGRTVLFFPSNARDERIKGS